MKVYLSSYRVPTPKDLEQLVGKSYADMRVVFVANAKDYYIDRIRDLKINETKAYFEALGVQHIDVVDLRMHREVKSLSKKLQGYDLIWVNGGNTFMLRYEMKRSGFDTVLPGLLKKGAVYGGESAGAVVAGSSLLGVELADSAEFAEEIIWSGLGLIEKSIIPHADNPNFEAMTQQIVAQRSADEIVVLKDSEALVIDGSAVNVVKAELV